MKKPLKKYIEDLIVSAVSEKNGEFYSLVHPEAKISKNVIIGRGCIIDRHVILGSDSRIGDFALIQYGAVIGHDVQVGAWSRIDNYVVIVGGAIIGNEVCIHTGSIINNSITVGDNSIVGANSFVIRKVRCNTTVFGSPAKTL